MASPWRQFATGHGIVWPCGILTGVVVVVVAGVVVDGAVVVAGVVVDGAAVVAGVVVVGAAVVAGVVGVGAAVVAGVVVVGAAVVDDVGVAVVAGVDDVGAAVVAGVDDVDAAAVVVVVVVLPSVCLLPGLPPSRAFGTWDDVGVDGGAKGVRVRWGLVWRFEFFAEFEFFVVLEEDVADVAGGVIEDVAVCSRKWAAMFLFFGS